MIVPIGLGVIVIRRIEWCQRTGFQPTASKEK
jgi:hypothetical protein